MDEASIALFRKVPLWSRPAMDEGGSPVGSVSGGALNPLLAE
jgi:hypothetical protein